MGLPIRFSTLPSGFSPLRYLDENFEYLQDQYSTLGGAVLNPVTSFGADPTGAQDSTEALQEWLDTQATLPGAFAAAPTGTYKISAALVIPPALKLVSWNFSILRMDNSTPGTQPAFFRTTSTSGLTIENVLCECIYQTYTTGICQSKGADYADFLCSNSDLPVWFTSAPGVATILACNELDPNTNFTEKPIFFEGSPPNNRPFLLQGGNVWRLMLTDASGLAALALINVNSPYALFNLKYGGGVVSSNSDTALVLDNVVGSGICGSFLYSTLGKNSVTLRNGSGLRLRQGTTLPYSNTSDGFHIQFGSGPDLDTPFVALMDGVRIEGTNDDGINVIGPMGSVTGFNLGARTVTFEASYANFAFRLGDKLYLLDGAGVVQFEGIATSLSRAGTVVTAGFASALPGALANGWEVGDYNTTPNAQLTGSYIYRTTGRGIVTSTQRALITGNLIQETFGAACAGGRYYHNSFPEGAVPLEWKVSGNLIVNCNQNGFDWGAVDFRVWRSTFGLGTAQAKNVQIRDNVIRGTRNAGIFCSSALEADLGGNSISEFGLDPFSAFGGLYDAIVVGNTTLVGGVSCFANGYVGATGAKLTGTIGKSNLVMCGSAGWAMPPAGLSVTRQDSTQVGAPIVIDGGSAQFQQNLRLGPSTHASSRRAAITIDQWSWLQDIAGNGTKNFGLFSVAYGNTIFSIDLAGATIWTPPITFSSAPESFQFSINNAAGTVRSVAIFTALSLRWQAGANQTAEAGANSGSNYVINRYSDAGAYLSTPFFIDRASGLVSIASLVSTTITVTTLTGTSVVVNGAAATLRTQKFQTSTTIRAEWGLNQVAESGANSGSNIVLNTYSDAGAYLATPISVNRATGITTLLSLAVTSSLTIGGSTFLFPATNTPATAASAGTKGMWCWDSNYIYICVATDTWKRVAIATW